MHEWTKIPVTLGDACALLGMTSSPLCMSTPDSSSSRSSSDDDLLHRSSGIRHEAGAYELIDASAGVKRAEVELEELDLDGSPIYHDEDEHFDYPETEKAFGEVVVVMKHIQKGS